MLFSAFILLYTIQCSKFLHACCWAHGSRLPFYFMICRGHTPGALTDLRSALVNNAIFASLSVRYEFHKYIKLMSPAIFHLVEKYVKEQRERDQNVTLFTEDIVSFCSFVFVHFSNLLIFFLLLRFYFCFCVLFVC